MAVSRKIDAASSLATLQVAIDQEEPGLGALDGIESLTENGQNFTLVTFDDGMVPSATPMTTLKLASDPPPAQRLLFLQGDGFISGQKQTIAAYIPLDQGLIVKRLVAVLISLGWSGPAAAGIAANIQAESNFKPNSVGDGGAAYGLCQWHAGRQQKFQQTFGRRIQGSTFRNQLEFINWELNNTERAAGNALTQATTTTQAADIVCRLYERPQNPDAEAQTRVAIAAQLASTGLA